MAKYLQNSTDIEINESGDNLQFTMVKTKLLNLIYPVGSIYMSATNTNPGSTLGGTWVAWGSGKVPVGIDSTDTDFNTAEKTGGTKKVALTKNDLPKEIGQALIYDSGTTTQSSSMDALTTQWTNKYRSGLYNVVNEQGGNAHNNLQPYITCYMFKRTA